ncbi:MAG: tetratricopeptide repeat protein [Ignavibacteriaceae bacterium]
MVFGALPINRFRSLLILGTILVLTFSSSFSQVKNVEIKNEAQKQISLGRYGEAIELLNKFITANPRIADGYNLRALCYEKRTQYEFAVYDYRNALKLPSVDKSIANNLARVIQVWYDQLYLKIEGHRREIAINPDKGVNYLEIGKCYKHMGQWGLAEQWYDEFLRREEASADEVIRYSEILAKNGHIEKGEKILKIYVEKYPKDHRLWSRYGYFTLWLGKIKIAIEAFETALVLRPFFLEAQDGLDQALGKGYTYSINDTSYSARKQSVEGIKKPPPPPEYPIDRYYRILKRKPNDDETRFLLVTELSNANRFEEALEQLEILSENHGESDRFINLYTRISAVRDSIYYQNITEIKDRFEKDPNNKEDLVKLTSYYNKLTMFEEASGVFTKYFENNPNEEDLDLRYRFAETSAWNRNFDMAAEQSNIILEKDPENLKYQLLSAQLSAWTEIDVDRGKQLVENILAKEPKNFQALITAGLLAVEFEEFDAASQYLSRAKEINPTSNDVNTLDLRITFEKLRYEENKIFEILEKGRDLAANQDCEGALPYYEEFLLKSQANRLIQKEYADILTCAKQYDKAIEIYSNLLQEEYSFNVDYGRAKAFLWKGDSLTAVTELERLKEVEPEDFFLNLFLGDAYKEAGMYRKARKQYEALLDVSQDTTEIAIIEQRIGWLPITGVQSFLSTFPAYSSLTPSFSYYSDNNHFSLINYGLNFELGAFDFLSLSIGMNRGSYINDAGNSNLSSHFSSIISGIYIRFAPITVGSMFGTKIYSSSNRKSDYFNLFARASRDSLYNFSLTYINTDAPEILYSSLLTNATFRPELYILSGDYNHKDIFRILGNYKYLIVNDNIKNKGEIYDLRLGKYFLPELIAGYEFAVSNFIKTSRFYFSPQNFMTHSIWGEYTGLSFDEHEIMVGAKVGIIMDLYFIATELIASYKTKFFERLQFQIFGRLGQTTQNIGAYSGQNIYNSHSITASLSWAL